MSKKKLITSLLFFVLLVLVTFYIIFSQNDISSIGKTISSINYIYIIIAIALVVLYFYMQGLYMKLLLKTLNIKISIFSGIFYAIVEFFFSAVTPSSTGGQPVQLYYMTKDKIPAEKSVIVLILNTIMFKLFIVVFGFLILIFYRNLVFGGNPYATLLFWLGMIVDTVIVVLGYLLIFNKALVEKIIRFFYKIIYKITKKDVDYEKKIQEITDRYSNNAEYIKGHKKDVFVGTIITFIQRMLLFSITFVVYIALGLKGISYFKLLLLQTFTQIAIEALPLPGGTGALEAIINNVYLSIFGSLTVAGTVLVRIFSFYLPLVITMFIIIFTTKFRYKKRSKSERGDRPFVQN